MKKALSLLLLLLVIRSTAQDQNYNIDDVEIYSRRKVTEATRQRVTIDSTTLQAFQSSTLGDLLLQSSPVNIKSYGRGDTQSATFRGTAPSHTAVYWNGVRINSPMVGAVDLGLIPLFFADRVSVDAGVSSMAVTSGALGGVVSIESAPDWSKTFGIEAVERFGSFTTSDSYLRVIAGNGTFQSSTKLFYTYSKNDFTFINRDIIDPTQPDFRPTQRNENGDYRRSGFMQEFFVRLDSVQSLTAIVWGLNGDSNLPQLTTYEGDKSNNLTDRHDASLRAAITYKRYGRLCDLTTNLTGDMQSMGFNQQNLTGAGYQNTIESRGVSRSVSAMGEVSLKFFEHHSIGLRADARVDYVDSRERVKGLGFERSRGEASLMAALYSSWGRWFNTSVSLRALAVGNSIYATPFIGTEFRLSSPLSIKARVGYNVHNPTISDLYYVPGGNPDLTAERALTAEVGMAYSKGGTRVDVNVFSSWINDWIIWLPSNQQYWTPRNVKSVLSRGVELTASNLWQWGFWRLYANLNLTLNHTVNNGSPIAPGDESVGKQLVYVPLLSAGVYVKGSWQRLWLSYRIYGESERYTTTSNNPGVQGSIDPYTLSDVAAGYGWRMFSLELKCSNVFNSRYYTVLRRPLPGRSYEVMLRFKI